MNTNRMLIKGVHTLVTMVDGDAPLHGVDVKIADGRIEAVGSDLGPTEKGDTVVDGTNCVAYPGFINTHHHLYQSLTRNLPRVQNAKLFTWLENLYEVWRGLTPEAVEVSAKVAMGELLLSGCTTTTDHLYLFPRNAPGELLDVTIGAAGQMGMRFHPTRGSMSRGKTEGGLPPDDVVQDADTILRDSQRVIEQYHDPSPYSMCRIALAPCSPFSVTTDLMKETARLGRDKGVLLHTHLCETKDEEDYCLTHYGKRPLAYMEETEWLGPDVWYAHGIYFDDEEIATLAGTGTGVAHCPGSNLRLGSGICKVPQLLDQGVRVGLAVDGSASNDAGNVVREMQLALLVHRIGTGVDAMPPETVLRMATVGGAEILNWPELGRVQVGAAADLALFRLDRVDFAGAMHAPASALLFCGAGQRAEYTIVGGKILVEKGQLAGEDEERLFHRANEVSDALVTSAEERTGVGYR
ncbi:MAG: 8-oxoguanine deaminase [Kiritimatiellia bacterium]|nr:8-oxoguanine deaminase [Kiritimatiellia bacterium]MDP6631758.1 8-oxoguanine deaminase [Kiritimatiellia bacterium]MDP6810488.1 8-oxoguanine deaminase [Kiritimatiellia bacterium]MDP7024994.1 8-oxoguanine deaminase [Kiritimatiellia bacterium]